jgi:hypothetical protein
MVYISLGFRPSFGGVNLKMWRIADGISKNNNYVQLDLHIYDTVGLISAAEIHTIYAIFIVFLCHKV